MGEGGKKPILNIDTWRKNSARGKVIDKKWFIGIGCLWYLQVEGERVHLRTWATVLEPKEK